ncbi:hypothetical protein EAS61_18995 [Bradyrhizobium zhanjiangense]|uniref:AbiTii domain-containing protein n=2 Tax=Bradyrhizobium zhanjiangense TaxID=1325107 RepID=A0A4Q0QNI0_9BRAD|nr:hypothetical protein EAS61_18995 [Bradyrhizobium zhanjiangense]
MIGPIHLPIVIAMDVAAALARIHDHVEHDRVENAVMACLRVARTAKDYLHAAIFLRELYPDKREIARVLHEETKHLNDETKKFLYKKSLDRYLDVHSINRFADPGTNEPENVLMVAAGEIESEIVRWQGALDDLKTPAGLPPDDVAAFTVAAFPQKADLRERIAGLHTIKARLKSRCLNYAIAMEQQLKAEQQQESFLHGVQNEVHNYFKGRADDVLQKLMKANQLAAPGDSEDSALLLTEVRRALKAAADLFWPVVSEAPVRCVDGQERKLGDQQYLNRLQEFMRVKLRDSTARELLTAELDHLEVFFRRLNDLASKGVHAEVTVAEARQGLVSVYFFLSNLIRHLVEKCPEATKA